MSAALAVQSALFQALRSDVALGELVGGAIHDGPPQGAGFPHVGLAELSSLDWAGEAGEGEEHMATFLVWSRAGGRREALEILGAMVAVLDEASLTLAGHRLVNCRVETSDTRREPDGRTWRGRLRLRAVTERD